MVVFTTAKRSGRRRLAQIALATPDGTKMSVEDRVQQLQEEVSDLDGGRYQIQKWLGEGSYGVVAAALDTKTGVLPLLFTPLCLDVHNGAGEKVAVKKVLPMALADARLSLRILREVKLLSFFSHENVIELKAVLLPPGSSRENFRTAYIVMSLCDADLRHVLKHCSGQLTPDHVRHFVFQALRGLNCVHGAGVIHRDITTSNLLVDSDCSLKICDFGMARKEVESAMTDYVTMRWYRAPELLMQERHYGPAVDVWSLGCILGELLGRTPLFPGRGSLQQLNLILGLTGTPPPEELTGIGSQAIRDFIMQRGALPRADWRAMYPDACDDALHLLDSMLQFLAAKRITVAEALQHPFLAPYHDQPSECTCPGPFTPPNVTGKSLSKVKSLLYDFAQLYVSEPPRPAERPLAVYLRLRQEARSRTALQVEEPDSPS